MDRYDYELLKGIKARLGITGPFHDELLMMYAEDVRQYMFSAGVDPRLVNGPLAIGCISRGVADLWNKGSEDGRFSQVFLQRVIQLATPRGGCEDGSGEFDGIDTSEIDGLFDPPGPPRPDYRPVRPRKRDYEVADHGDIVRIVESPPRRPPRPPLADNEDIGDILDGEWDGGEPPIGPPPGGHRPCPVPPWPGPGPDRPPEPPFGPCDWYGHRPPPKPPRVEYIGSQDINALFEQVDEPSEPTPENGSESDSDL